MSSHCDDQLVLNPWPHFDADEVEAAAEVLRSGQVNYWTGGLCKAFEQAFADWIGVPYGIAVANGTLALELALHALEVGQTPHEEVIVPARTFVATASAVVRTGAKPVAADVDLDTQVLTVETIDAVVTDNTRAIVVVHLAGWPADMPAICAYAAEKGIRVIEDCAQAHGARIAGQHVGSFGNAAAYSFCQDKIMTTGGEGGLFACRDEAVWLRAWSYKEHGKSYAKVQQSHPPGFRWLVDSFGTNYRLTEMQAAIGLRQLEKLPDWVLRRRQHAQCLQSALSCYPFLRLPMPGPDIEHAYYKCYAFVRPDKLPAGLSRDDLIAQLNAASVPCFAGICPEIYREQAFVTAGLAPAAPLPQAQALGETSLMFLVHHTITVAQMEAMVARIVSVLDAVATGGVR